MAKKIILLTGAAGRVGNLMRPLLRTHYHLRLCDIAPIGRLSRNEEFIRGDLADPAIARAAASGTAGVVHLAGLVAPDVSFEDTLDPNYRAVLALLEACRHLKVKRFVFASTAHVMGMRGLEEPDSPAEVSPDGFYGLSKAFGEAACSMYARRFGLIALIIRIGNVTPEVTDGRRERMWVSARDLAQLIRIGLAGDNFICETVYGVSRVNHPVFSNGNARRLGYGPRDDSSKNLKADFIPLSKIKPAKSRCYVGGSFAVNKLPNPLEKTWRSLDR